ncbi:hypothetical protein [Mycolicibacterium canariasense]|uniref:hypothetical protein n=1 Tax=Mycolicibacterium canariasense TaxID=228230 RepID=UPI0013F4EB7C|nr:hypothetical protein [Mycolicibacterium canariasense]MCV7212540.1 hypothetical protein [Mycolicibacterium canariasense]
MTDASVAVEKCGTWNIEAAKVIERGDAPDGSVLQIEARWDRNIYRRLLVRRRTSRVT